MYRFQISAVTQPGETIALVGSIPQMGSWDVVKCVRLRTRGDRYPIWWVDLELNPDQWADLHYGSDSVDSNTDLKKIEYQYVRLRLDGTVEWEASGSNRWVPFEVESLSHASNQSNLSHPTAPIIVVEDGTFGYVQPYPYGYRAETAVTAPVSKTPSVPGQGLKIVVIGSSVALGCSAWLLRGWAWQLEQALQQNGHPLVNRSAIGTNVTTTIARFQQTVAPEQPDVVIIALSLGNEGLAHCPPAQQRELQRRFESGLQELVKMTRDLGAIAIVGGVYPNGDYLPQHYRLLKETRNRMLTWDVPVLDWLPVLDDGQGRWKAGISFDPAHPNSEGHRLMYEAIDLRLFNPKSDLTQTEIPIYRDDWGFSIFTAAHDSLRIVNASAHSYTLDPSWQDLQTALRQARLTAGMYLAQTEATGVLPALAVQPDGAIATVTIPAGADLTYYPAHDLFALERCDMLFYDGYLGIFKESDRRLCILNESDHDYNLHPMWKEIRSVLKAMPSGVYNDPMQPDAPFRTMMIGNEGLESRVKVPPQSMTVLAYQGSLDEVSRVAIIPLGDRCAARMLLYKLEYDGPAFPFDLTRTTNLADVADMIQSGFSEMWNPALLDYNHDARRIYHRRWSGLSFAHEVEDSDDPLNDMSPVYQRMRDRYSARSARFWYTLQNCDKALFIRTGVCDRASVADLVHKLEAHCQGKPFRLLLISPQPSDEFAELTNVVHYDLEFNPDRMYDDLEHWHYCTEVMRGILDSLGISSNNLFWCPPNPPKES